MATVCAVMKVMVEVHVRPSNGAETMDQLLKVSESEAEEILRRKLPNEIRVVGPIEFSHAMVREMK